MVIESSFVRNTEKQICKTANFISSAARVMLSSLFLWSSYSEFFSSIYIQKSHLNDSDLFSWQFEDTCHCHWAYISWIKRQSPFWAPPPWVAGAHRSSSSTSILCQTLCATFLPFIFLESEYWIYNSRWHWGPLMSQLTVMICHAGYVWIIFF